MNRLMCVLAMAWLLVVSVAACGGAHRPAPTAASEGPVGGGLPRDHDGDATDDQTGGYYDGDDRSIRYFGRQAGAIDRRAVEAVVERYYAAAARDDGATACMLIDPILVEGMTQGQRGGCAGAMSRLLAHVPGRSTADLAAVAVTGVRVGGDSGMALLRLRTSEARYMPVVRAGGAWKVETLLDDALL